ncbi:MULTISPECIES: hypothetical protein [unclassified Streptococcus]|uniref:hypothetical protein n=1 Tax=unclassified Streptococcus TaxID=2608887 RepID=UPI0020C8F284|nr:MULTISPECIES: hypothetical protein [unclassified Streptococcus]MCP8962806.1 hypothetical protein [Streptococcus sp. CF8_St5-12]MCP8980747.1 hypothetical protein [Streptococcus sp. CF8_St5-16]MCP8982595.1 hypothetical protein [Streptococcus sp. CF8_St5-13]MCP9039774.1 hypothetical protein [Streptococcus sp. CF8_St5-11]
MTNQEKHLEENKEHSKISEDYPNSVSVQNPPKENSLHSILLSVTFYLSIIYLVLFVFFFNILGFFMLLIFLTPNFLGVAIGTILLGLGMKKGNKSLLYTSVGLYLLSIILGFELDWDIFRIAPLLLGILVLIGTLLVEEEKSS